MSQVQGSYKLASFPGLPTVQILIAGRWEGLGMRLVSYKLHAYYHYTWAVLFILGTVLNCCRPPIWGSTVLCRMDQFRTVWCVFTQGMRMVLKWAVSSFLLFSLLGCQVPLGFDCPVPDGDSATDDLCHCAHCCALRTTPVNSLQCEHIYWAKAVCMNWLLCPECHDLVWNTVLLNIRWLIPCERNTTCS